MAAIEEFFRINGDKRVAELTFMSSPWEVLSIAAFYVYFCYDLGPHRLMKNRTAFDLVWTVRIFNTLILLLNLWLLHKFFTLLNWGYDSIGCAVSTSSRLSVCLPVAPLEAASARPPQSKPDSQTAGQPDSWTARQPDIPTA